MRVLPIVLGVGVVCAEATEVSALMEQPPANCETPPLHYKHCGFVSVVLGCTGFSALDLNAFVAVAGAEETVTVAAGVFRELIGAECALTGSGSVPQIRIENSPLILFPLAEEENSGEDGCGRTGNGTAAVDKVLGEGMDATSLSSYLSPSQQSTCGERGEVSVSQDGDDCLHGMKKALGSFLVSDVAAKEIEQCGDGSSAKRKRATTKIAGMGSVLHQLQWMRQRNHAKVQGHVVALAQRAGNVRVVALLDLWLPSNVWSIGGFWKSRAVAATALAHLRLVISLPLTNDHAIARWCFWFDDDPSSTAVLASIVLHRPLPSHIPSFPSALSMFGLGFRSIRPAI